MASYPASHWQKKLADYSATPWAGTPNPFAIMTASHVPAGGDILELGTGVGQDGLWFSREGFNVTATDAQDQFFASIQDKNVTSGGDLELKVLDVTQPFEFVDQQFNAVYAHLVLHYFNDEEMESILSEIKRVLKPGGILAVLVNSQADSEYDASKAEDGLIDFGTLTKRYFTFDMLGDMMQGFDTIILDDNGKTAKDEAIGNSGLIQFIGMKHGR